MRSVRSLRRLALTGVWSGLAAMVPYVEPIPWLELQTLVVFAAGYFLGAGRGAAVGALAMAVYSLANPYGPAHPLVFAAQLLGRAGVGGLGGLAAAASLSPRPWHRGIGLAAWSVAASLVYDLPTNLATAVLFGPLLPVLVAGVPFAALHLLSNAALFWTVGVPLTKALDARRASLLAAAIGWALASVAASPAPAEARSAAAPADTLAPAAPADTLPPATPADTLAPAAPADTIAGRPPTILPTPGADSVRVRLARTAPALPREAVNPWALELDPGSLYRLRAGDPDDALPYLAASPRFYGDAGSVEEVRFGAMPGGIERGSVGASALEAPSSPWVEVGRVADGGLAGWAWSPRGRHPSEPYPGTASFLDPWLAEQRAEPSSRWGFGAEEARAVVGRPLTSVWVGTGSWGRRSQGFDLQFWQGVGATLWRGRWSAWSRNTGPIGRLGDTGAHGNLLAFEGRGSTWQWEGEYRSQRTALGDIGATLTERRGAVSGRTRFGWRSLDGGHEAGLAAGLAEDRTTGEGAISEPLERLAGDSWARLFGGAAAGAWRLSAEGGWSRQRVEHRLSDTTRYAPPTLDVWSLSGAAEWTLLGGNTRLTAEAQEAAGSVAVLPGLDWTRAVSASTRLWLGAGASRRARVAEAGKLTDSSEPPFRETTTAASAVAAVRWERRAASLPVPSPSSTGVPLPGGFVRADLAAVAWRASGALFPAYALFAREVLEGTAVAADVDGAAAIARLDWAPLSSLELGGTGYAAARELPEGVASGVPDYRLLLWAGPRLVLFHRSVEIALRVEADRLGPRPTAGGSLPALWRVGGRLSLGFGDAWLVLRAVDLVGAEAPLPGDGPDGVPLTSPERQWRLYGEWRLLD